MANVSELPYCYNESRGDPNGAQADTITFWLEGVLISVVGLVGILGNILTTVVLKRGGSLKSNAFNQLIVILCLFDSFFVLISILEYSCKKAFKFITYTTPIFVNLWPTVVYPLHNITFSVSLFVTLAIAIERYIAVCYPFAVRHDRRSRATLSRSSFGHSHPLRSTHHHHHHHQLSVPKFRKRALCYILPAVSFALAINIPKFFEFKNVLDRDNRTTIVPTELRLNLNYELYYINWTRTILTAIAPFGLLTVLNGRIIYQLKSAQLGFPRGEASSHSRREANLTNILVLMVFCFLFCNLGKFILNLYDLAIGFDRIKECSEAGLIFHSPLWVKSLMSINHLLLVMNASSNLFLFTLIGTQFRTTLLAIMHLRKQHERRASPQSPTNSQIRHRSIQSMQDIDNVACLEHEVNVDPSGRRSKFWIRVTNLSSEDVDQSASMQPSIEIIELSSTRPSNPHTTADRTMETKIL